MSKSIMDSGDSCGGVEVDESRRLIYLDGVIDSTTARSIIMALLKMEKADPTKPIDFRLNTLGGDAYHCLAIHDVMRSLQCDVRTYALGVCASAGAVLLCAGDKRFAYPYSHIMIHELYCYNEGRLSDVETLHNHLRQLEAQSVEIIAKHTGRDPKEIAELVQSDVWFTPGEALAFGLIDEVILPRKG